MIFLLFFLSVYFPVSIALGTVPIPLTFDDDGRYLVNMTTGSAQSFGLALTTSTGDIILKGNNCTSCNGGPAYNVSASTTAIPISNDNTVDLFGLYASGDLISENCGLFESNGSTWSYHDQTMLVADQTNATFSSRMSGVFGLGTTSTAGNNSSDTLYGQYFIRNPSATNFTFGMALNSSQKNSTDAGILHWTETNPSAYTGEITWMNTTAYNSTSVPSDWVIEMSGWTLQAEGHQTSGPACITIIDPFYPQIYLPLNLIREIYSNIPGATPQVSPNGEVWQVPCSTAMSFSATFGNQTFNIDQTKLITNINGSCYGTIEGWSPDICYLGSSFLSSIYLIFLILLINNTFQTSMGMASRSTPSGTSTSSVFEAGGIAGGVIAAILLVSFLIFIIVRRRRASRSPILVPASPSLFGTTSATFLLPPSADSYHTNFSQQFQDSHDDFSSLIPHTAPERPVTVSIERNTESLGSNQNTVARPQLAPPISSQENIALTPVRHDFTIEPFLMPPPNVARPQPISSKDIALTPVQHDFTIEPFLTPPLELARMEQVRRDFEERKRREKILDDPVIPNETPDADDAESISSGTLV